MHRRINITLPEQTIQLIDSVARRGDRSRFIDEAVKRYLDEVGRATIRRQLKEGAVRRAEHKLRLAQEWFLLDEEAWQRSRK